MIQANSVDFNIDLIIENKKRVLEKPYTIFMNIHIYNRIK